MRDLTFEGLADGTSDLILVGYRAAQDGGDAAFLADESFDILELVPPPEGLTFGFAVARPYGEGRLAILGYLDLSSVQQAAGLERKNGWLELRHGKAALRLHEDGRVRVSGNSIGLEADGTCFIDAGEIRLN